MKRSLSTLSALVVGASCLFLPATASAAPASHCWIRVSDGESKCFSTFAAVVTDLSDGRITASGPASFGSRDATALAALTASVTAAIVYEDSSYGGASATFLVGSACDADPDVDWQISLAGSTWDNRISSFKSFNGCATRLWTGVYTGTSYGFFQNSTNVGASMNDQASSIQWN